MSHKEKSSGISRRKFIQNVSGGVVGGAVALHSLPVAGKSRDREAEKYLLQKISFELNGKSVTVSVEPRETLVQVLREKLQLTGTKVVCNHGECGGCTVILDGKAVYSCLVLALDVAGKKVMTIEGLMHGEEINELQKAFIEKDGMQCGFCTPGQIMSAYALLQENPKPTREEILTAMSGNLCRCGAYPKIIDSVEEAARRQNAK